MAPGNGAPVVRLDGTQFNDVDTLLLGALTLSAVTRLPFELGEVGRTGGTPGLTARHVAAVRAMARLCDAVVEGDAPGARHLRFTPQHGAEPHDLTIDIGEVIGRPSPLSITPLIEMVIPALALARGDSFLRFRGANATPFNPSAFWLRETLAPMLRWLNIEAAVEIEKWGWYPDGGGEVTLLVTGLGAIESGSTLHWDERGDPVELWALVALSPRASHRLGKQMTLTVQQALVREPIATINVEEARVRSPGPGSGVYLSLHCEQVMAGFESIAYQGMSGEQVGEEATTALNGYFWSDAAFESELARAMMIPLALSGRPASFTTPEATLPLRVLEFLIPRFLPARVSITKHPAGAQVQLGPA